MEGTTELSGPMQNKEFKRKNEYEKLQIIIYCTYLIFFIYLKKNKIGINNYFEQKISVCKIK